MRIDDDAAPVEVSGSIRLADLPMGIDQIDVVARDCLKEPLDLIGSAISDGGLSLESIATGLLAVARAIDGLAEAIRGRA